MARSKREIAQNVPFVFITLVTRRILRLDKLITLVSEHKCGAIIRRCIAHTPMARPSVDLVYYLLLNAVIVWPRGHSLWLVKLPRGPRWLTPNRSDAIDHINAIWRKNIYGSLTSGKIAIDAGAHIGIYTVKASKDVGEKGLVVAIEPHPENFKCLVRNLELNKCENVIPINAALFSQSGEGTLFVDEQSVGHSIVIKRSDKAIKVCMITLDEIKSNLGISHIDYIKVDVEGATIAALQGAENVISTYKPKIIVEIAHYPNEASETENLLSHYGYTTYVDSEIMYAEIKGE